MVDSLVERLIRSSEVHASLFAVKPSRRNLMAIDCQSIVGQQSIRVNVWRNHNFEVLIPLLNPYMAYGGFDTTWTIGAYDDSLAFINHSQCDIELLWIDCASHVNRMSFSTWLDWIMSRLRVLRSKSQAPIVVCTWFELDSQAEGFSKRISEIVGVYFGNIRIAADEIDILSESDPKVAATAIRIRHSIHTSLARVMATMWLAGSLPQRIKVVAVDLDNTLYSGVIGEDGPESVRIDAHHVDFQKVLVRLYESGIIIAITSKNNLSDVTALFDLRRDFPLRLDHVTYVQASWKSKVDSIMDVVRESNVGLDSVLFIDDSLSEVFDVVSSLPEVKFLYAPSDSTWLANSVAFYPGLHRLSYSDTDSLRLADLRANRERMSLLNSQLDFKDYHRDLCVELCLYSNPTSIIDRISALSNKTNQFNMSLSRFTASQVESYIQSKSKSIVAISLADRLADSGVIAVVAAKREEARLYIDDLCISCRALGRGLENYIIGHAILTMTIAVGVDTVTFRFTAGPKNIPALDWLRQISDDSNAVANGVVEVSISKIESLILDCNVGISRQGDM
jgi:FkbH-like protein